MSKKINKSEVKMVESSVLESKIALTFCCHLPGNYRKTKPAALVENEAGETVGQLSVTETSALTIGRKLLESKELKAITNHKQTLYNTLASKKTGKAVPSFIKEGFYFIDAEIVPEIVGILESARAEQKDLVEKFLAVYEGQIDEMERKLAGSRVFKRSDYYSVDAMREKFGIEYNLFRFEVAKNLPPEVLKAEQLKLQKSFKKSEVLIAQCLTESFEELLSGIQDKLAPGNDGKAKAFHKTLFDDLAEFMGNFNSRNLVNDKDLASLVTKANGILASVRGDKVQDKALVVKSSDELRESTRAQFQAIRAAIEKDIKPKLGRAFNFDLD